MTVYNGLPYLAQAVESVLNQTFADFEFLIVDDKSTDDSVACVRSYADPRIRLVLNEVNLGQARSLNKGLELARGRYIARLDQDDLCLPRRLEKQVMFLEERPNVAIVGTWIYLLDSAGNRTGPWGETLDDYASFLSHLLLGGCFLFHPSVMFRCEAVIKVGCYDQAFAPAEDVDLWVRLALARYNAAVISEPLLTLRLHSGQQSNAEATTQRWNGDRARQKLVEAFCDARESPLAGLLLRRDDAFWSECRTKSEVRSVLVALSEMLANMRAGLGLTPQEFGNLSHQLYCRLADGARVAILSQHRQSLPVYLFAFRGGLKMTRCPFVLFYPLLYVFSPFLVPKVRQILRRLAGMLRGLRPVRHNLVSSSPEVN